MNKKDLLKQLADLEAQAQAEHATPPAPVAPGAVAAIPGWLTALLALLKVVIDNLPTKP